MKNKKNKKKKHTTVAEPTTIKGVLEITRSGLGYVVVKEGTGSDIIIKQGDFNTALHGDIVRAKVTKQNFNTGRREGTITEVVGRKQTQFIGHIQLSPNFAFFVPESKKPIPDFYIAKEHLNGATHQQKVVVELLSWKSENKKPTAKVISFIANEPANKMAMKEILAEGGFPLQFAAETLEASKALSEVLDEEEVKNRIDFRDTITFTIDPIDAKDFDDAISVKTIKKGLYEIGVHIADVSHYVLPDGALDKEAYQRATSVYLPDRVNPMLPEKISNELCSLRPKEDKFTFSAIFEMNAKGEIKKTTLSKTVIHSNHRFTYEEAQEIIEGKSKEPFKEEILLLNSIGQQLRKKRFAKGAINFSSKEVRFKLDADAKPIGIMVKESKEAHQLIEEFMLLANKAVAEFVSEQLVNNKPIPFAYRIHDTPDEEKLTPFITFAKKYGHKFNISSPEKIAESFNQLLQDAKGKPEQQVLETLGIRTMAKAVYTTQNIGHYGLGFKHYCHFTSPIRRYPDVLVHRVLQSILQGKPMVDKKMEEKCKHSSLMERAAMDCERAGNKYKQVEFMMDKLGHQFDAVISGVAAFGFWAETIEHKCEGLVSIVDLSDFDDFRLVENDYSLVGKRSGRKFRMGDSVKIQLVAANLDKRQLDYMWVM